MLRFWVLSVVLVGTAACGVPSDPGEETEPEAVSEPLAGPPVVSLTVSDHFSDLGGEVTALAALPQALPFRSRLLAAIDAEDESTLALIDLAQGVVTGIAMPPATSLIAAPDFQLRGLATPLIVTAGADGRVSASLLLEQEFDLDAQMANDADLGASVSLVPVPTPPIAPDLRVQRLCLLRASDAVIEFIVVDRNAAQVWRLRDTGEELLSAELLRDAPEAVNARACAPRRGGQVLTLDPFGRLGDSTPAYRAVTTTAQDDQLTGEIALATREDGRGVAALDIITGQVLAQLDISGGLNTPDINAPRRLVASTASFGGSYGEGVLAVATDQTVSIIALDTLDTQLRALD